LNNFIDFNNQSWNLVIQCNYIREFEKDMQLTFHGIYDGFAQMAFNILIDVNKNQLKYILFYYNITDD